LVRVRNAERGDAPDTQIIVADGINDIGWGIKADEQHKKAYLDGIRGIVEACQKQKVSVFICSAAITAEDPAKAEKGFLQRMCDDGMELSRSLDENSIGVQRITGDGVCHPEGA
jgi:DNA-binding LacI/PurR family transcriptional regulator